MQGVPAARWGRKKDPVHTFMLVGFCTFMFAGLGFCTDWHLACVGFRVCVSRVCKAKELAPPWPDAWEADPELQWTEHVDQRGQDTGLWKLLALTYFKNGSSSFDMNSRLKLIAVNVAV